MGPTVIRGGMTAVPYSVSSASLFKDAARGWAEARAMHRSTGGFMSSKGAHTKAAMEYLVRVR
jgi:hypothetical protein